MKLCERFWRCYLRADGYHDFSDRCAGRGTCRYKNLNKPIRCIFAFHGTNWVVETYDNGTYTEILIIWKEVRLLTLTLLTWRIWWVPNNARRWQMVFNSAFEGLQRYTDPSHIWRYSPFRALASLTIRLHSSLFSALLLHPLIPSSRNTSLWTTPAHLVLGRPTGLVVWKFPFKTFFGILSSSILIMWPAHSNIPILMSSTMFGSLYKP